MKKYFLSMAMVFAFCFSMYLTVNAETPASISANSCNASAGEQFGIDCSISGNSGIAAYLIELSWEKDKIHIDDIVCGEAFSKGTFIKNIDEQGKATIMWYNPANIANNGVLFTIEGNISESIVSKNCLIKMELSKEDTVSESGQPVDIDCKDISIAILSNSTDGTTAHRSSGNSGSNTQKNISKVQEQTKNIAEEPSSISFIDISSTDYFFEAVNWALQNKITSGVSENQFGPGEACTRAQAVTFLWRNAGMPEPSITTGQFTDVKTTDYFYKAVMWAVENEITSGTDIDKFSPDAKVTRGQLVTFMWRSEGKENLAYTSNFTDVTDSDYFSKSVAWAVNNNITFGTSETTFSPNEPCTRGQTVTFLYRFNETFNHKQ